jgi:hypothetical protein
MIAQAYNIREECEIVVNDSEYYSAVHVGQIFFTPVTDTESTLRSYSRSDLCPPPP